jgi:hypothetical protein
VLIKNARATALIQSELRCKNNSLQSTKTLAYLFWLTRKEGRFWLTRKEGRHSATPSSTRRGKHRREQRCSKSRARCWERAVMVVTDILSDSTAISCHKHRLMHEEKGPRQWGPYEWIIKETLVCRHWTVAYLNPLLAVFVDITNCNAGFE